MSTQILTYPANGNLRLYNMFPYRNYDKEIGIDGMITYLPQVADMGFNAVWINPFQQTGTFIHPHPDKKSEVSGSLYAMASVEEFNPLIFPGCSTAECQEKLRIWTATARLNHLFPLFDLVLNHIALNQGEPSELFRQLDQKGLLLADIDPRWPDIKKIDYYKKGSTKHGLEASDKDLDEDKIAAVFEILWTPLISQYIEKYGFMGVRVDAITHVPAKVQQRAYQLIQQLVKATYNTEAIILGEFMTASPEAYVSELSTCGLTHSLHTCSFFWGHNQDGGYNAKPEDSPFLKQNQSLSEIVLLPPKAAALQNYKELRFIDLSYRECKANKIYILKKENKFYLYACNKTGRYSEQDLLKSGAVTEPLSKICERLEAKQKNTKEERQLLIQQLKTNHPEISEEELKKYSNAFVDLNTDCQANTLYLLKTTRGFYFYFCTASKKYSEEELCRQGELPESLNSIQVQLEQNPKISRNVKEEFMKLILTSQPLLEKAAELHHRQQNKGGLVAVIGNHDVGTLKAKIMLDLAASRALAKVQPNEHERINAIYKKFKDAEIKGIVNTSDLAQRLQESFGLSDEDLKQLYLDLDSRMREKIFIQAMMCSGGWYMIAGDELGVCHKPEVFNQFANNPQRVGSSLTERASHSPQHDLRSFIQGINKILARLPLASLDDVGNFSMHYFVMNNEVWGEKAADFLHIVVRHDSKLNKTTFIAHAPHNLNHQFLRKSIAEICKKNGIGEARLYNPENCEILLIDEKGNLTEDILLDSPASLPEKIPPKSMALSGEKYRLFSSPVNKKEVDEELLAVPLISGKQLAEDSTKTPVHLQNIVTTEPEDEVVSEEAENQKPVITIKTAS